jgi:CMP-N-acetylneuraminic acid synthetase
VIALIPARGGSSLKGKNIRDFRGKPLIRWTIDAAKESEVFDRIVVSSDSDAILSVCGDVETIKRYPELALDTTPMDAVILDFIQQPSDLIMLLQPTSPLRTADDIRQAKQAFKGDVLISVCRLPSEYLKAYIEIDGRLRPIYYSKTDRRQDLPPLYMPNGAIYLFKAKAFLKNNSIPKTNITPFIMKESLDVDTEADFSCC